MSLPLRGRVLSIAGSDPSGGAGLQADVKTITALGGYAMTAVTAVTVQNTLGVLAVHPVPPEVVDLQIEAVVTDLGVDSIKTGMLGSARVVEVVARRLRSLGGAVPLVVDPVLASGTGTTLLDAAGRRALLGSLLPLASLVTPNAPEAEALTGCPVADEAGMEHAAERLLLAGAEAVLVKGGHLAGDRVVDLLRTADGLSLRFESERIGRGPLHGTGCTLASAIALGLAEGLTLEGAILEARAFVADAIRSAPRYGEGASPLNHTCRR